MIKALLIALALALTLTESHSSDLPPLNVDPEGITVSGISAGGYFAQQLHLAYSDIFSGAGIVAGGPYGCAEGSLSVALARCMGSASEALDVAVLAERIETAVAEDRIPSPASLRDDPVWLFRGAQDATVPAVVADALADLYRSLSDRVVYVNDVPAAHHFPTVDTGHACDESVSPFIGACDFDGAGRMLGHLYGGLDEPGEAQGAVSAIAVPGAEPAHLMDEAFLFVPPGCGDQDASCRLHVVLHGCAQSSATVGDAFASQSGYLPWAEANRIVLLFPQVRASAANPYACWDWWGYTGPDYLYRGAVQMEGVLDLVRQLAGLTDQ
ncbi:MAG: PHB depolymerase family esterase [Xanthomonadales bacterium]|nr:PHB depolymerase family esterase [Xanthomonadales bacterium]